MKDNTTNLRIITSIISTATTVLIVLELSLFSGDDINNLTAFFQNNTSIKILTMICIVFSVLSAIFSLLLTIKTYKELKKEKERLNSTLNYINLLNTIDDKTNTYIDFINNMKKDKRLTKAEYDTLKQLFILSKSQKNDDEEIDLLLDESKHTLEKLTYSHFEKVS